MSKELYWAYNLPLQLQTVYEDPEDEESRVVGYKILNYIPRKEYVYWLDLEDTYDGVAKDEYLAEAVKKLRDLALKMEESIGKERPFVYYP